LLALKRQDNVKSSKILIKYKRGKIGFNWGKTQQMPKIDAGSKSKKNREKKEDRYWTINMSFGIYNKAFDVFKLLDCLSIERKVRFVLWSLLKEYWSFR
jgi:hypothetical protein